MARTFGVRGLENPPTNCYPSVGKHSSPVPYENLKNAPGCDDYTFK
jgi:hypothetical protein